MSNGDEAVCVVTVEFCARVVKKYGCSHKWQLRAFLGLIDMGYASVAAMLTDITSKACPNKVV